MRCNLECVRQTIREIKAKTNSTRKPIADAKWATIMSPTLWVYLHFDQPLMPPKSEKSREITRKFDLIVVQGHPRSRF